MKKLEPNLELSNGVEGKYRDQNPNDNFSGIAIKRDENLQEKRDRRPKKDFVISWQNLNYHIKDSKLFKSSEQPAKKQILTNLNGSFKSGELSAVLGPSGAGKTTLINCLLGRNGGNKITGRTQVDFKAQDEDEEQSLFRVATIPQKDHLMNTLTVMETFMFGSRLKNAANEEKEIQLQNKPFDHLANVQRILTQLNLESCSNVKCGKLSGGQRKRVSIGLELLSKPQLLFLDEPTTGLDASSSFQMIRMLRNLAESQDHPIAVVAIVHQPDIELANMFHKVYVLASEGRAIYEGSVRGIFKAICRGINLVQLRNSQYLSPNQTIISMSEGETELIRRLNEPYSIYKNPAKLVVEVASGLFGSKIIDSMEELQQVKLNSKGKKHKRRKGEDQKTRLDPILCSTGKDLESKYENNSWKIYKKHLMLHIKRTWISTYRDPISFTLLLILHIVIPIFISYSYISHPGDQDACPIAGPMDVVEEAYRPNDAYQKLRMEVRGIFENVGYVFFEIYCIVFGAICSTSLTYPSTMQVLLREYRNNWYSLSSYFIGKTIADLPIPVLNVTLAMSITYYSTNQANSPYEWRFLGLLLLTILATLIAQTQGLIVSAFLMDKAQSSVYFAPSSTVPFFLVCGFIMRVKSLPVPLQFLSKLSYPTHLINGFIILRYGLNRCPCDEQIFEIDQAHIIPEEQRKVMDPWVATFKSHYDQGELNGTTPDLIGTLVRIVSDLKTFGNEIENCDQLKPYAMFDYNLNDEDLLSCFIALVTIFFVFRVLAYLALSWKIRSYL